MVNALQHCHRLSQHQTKEDMKEILENHSVELPSKAENEIDGHCIPNPYIMIETSYKQDKYINDRMDIVNPKRIVLGTYIASRRHGAKNREVVAEDELFYMPLKDSLTQALSSHPFLQQAEWSADNQE